MLARAALGLKVQRCPSCNYCARDISESWEKTSQLIQSEEYKSQFIDQRYLFLANYFLCNALVYENAGLFANAGWACLYAAWVCDNKAMRLTRRRERTRRERMELNARTCREKAVFYFIQARGCKQSFARQPGEEQIILVDLLRRTRKFIQALKICEEALLSLSKQQESILCVVLRFQRMLINQADSSCHKVSEATEYSQLFLNLINLLNNLVGSRGSDAKHCE